MQTRHETNLCWVKLNHGCGSYIYFQIGRNRIFSLDWGTNYHHIKGISYKGRIRVCFTFTKMMFFGWIVEDICSGKGWFSTLEGYDELLGAKNTWATLSPLQSEIEAPIWAMECMRNLRQYHVTFATDYSQLVKMFLNQRNDQPLQVI